MAACERDTFLSSTGQPLDKRVWRPEHAPRGIVQLVHGMAEHIDRYDEVAQALADAGYLTCGHTHLGHGDKAKIKGHFADESGWDRLLDDIDLLRRDMEKSFPGVPYFLLGHSMGSFLTRCYLAKKADGLKGAIISGTGAYTKATVNAGIALCNLLCFFGGAQKPAPLVNRIAFAASNKPFAPNRTDFDWLTRCEDEVDKYVADPNCGFLFTAAGYRDMFRGIKRLTDASAVAEIPVSLPVLFLSGNDDPVGSMGKGVRQVAEQFRAAGIADVTVHLYDGGRHEMFNEKNRSEVYHDLIEWLDEHVVGSK